MDRLIQGIHRFRQNDLGKYQALFHRLSREGQRPHTLFITCSDSRVLVELITHSSPGDLFVVKNVGNIIPPSNIHGSTNSTAAAIEFAVQVIGVSDIVVCGHSFCGAMVGLLGGLKVREPMPNLNEWLELAAPVRELMETKYASITDDEERLATAAQENTLLGLENLRSYPFVQERLKQGALRLHAWFFKIDNAEMFSYNSSNHQFEPLL